MIELISSALICMRAAPWAIACGYARVRMDRRRSSCPRTVPSYTRLPKRISSPLITPGSTWTAKSTWVRHLFEPLPDCGSLRVGKRPGGYDLDRLAIRGLVGELAEGVADLPDEDDPVLADDVGEEPAGDRRAPGLSRHLIDDSGLLLLGKDRTQQQGAELTGGGEGFGQQKKRRGGRADPRRIL